MIIFWHQWVQINLPRAWKTLGAFHSPYSHQDAEVKEDCSPTACERYNCTWPSSCISNVCRSVEHMKCTQLQIVVFQCLQFTRASLMCPQLQYEFFQSITLEQLEVHWASVQVLRVCRYVVHTSWLTCSLNVFTRMKQLLDQTGSPHSSTSSKSLYWMDGFTLCRTGIFFSWW
jgi:hypothetical protein